MRYSRQECLNLIEAAQLPIGFISLSGIERIVISGAARTFRDYAFCYAAIRLMCQEVHVKQGVDVRDLLVEDRDKAIVEMMAS